jgi:hypothetical protein
MAHTETAQYSHERYSEVLYSVAAKSFYFRYNYVFLMPYMREFKVSIEQNNKVEICVIFFDILSIFMTQILIPCSYTCEQ